VFFREGSNTCGGCHRVQGQGQWVGPDLSTIGTKYGKEELLRSILNPSAAIGYNYQSLIIATGDGRVVTGLPVEQEADHVTLKTAEGKRVRLATNEIEDKKTSDVSLMPEGLAETMSDQDLVDLLAFLATLRQPVSIVGQYQAAGPLSSRDAARLVEGKNSLDTSRPLSAAGKSLTWRRLSANAESLVDLSSLVGNDASQGVLLHTPIFSANQQNGRLVIDTKAPAQVWLNGQGVALSGAGENAPRSAEVRLPQGPSELVILLQGAPTSTLVTTIVTPEPVEFAEGAGPKVSAK
jgi:putative heme-binding domain-containing protein